MAFISCDKLWRRGFYNVSAKDRVQDIFLNQSKPKVKDSYKKNVEITANYELSHDEDVEIKLI